jgi:hypothetical protein
MKNTSKMEQMQDLLLGMMQDLSDPKINSDEEIKEMNKRAKTMSVIGKVMVETAKVELEFMNKVGQLPNSIFTGEGKNILP